MSSIGLLISSAGLWLGVNLDEPKGRNDGTAFGKAYFSATPNHGLFVRQFKCTATVMSGYLFKKVRCCCTVCAPSLVAREYLLSSMMMR